MGTPQSGIFALGTASHAYLEFDAHSARDGSRLVGAISALREPRTTMGGFNQDLVGTDGFVMPAAQHDAVLWLSGSAYDVVFDAARGAMAELRGLARVAEESSSWPYRHDRDLTGFVDGTENPSLIDAPEVALVPDPLPGAGGTVLLLQKWVHDVAAWESLSVSQQEQVMGRTKSDSVELEDKAPSSHVGSTDQERFGQIFRRNMPYGTVTEHGTMFVGFSAEQQRLSTMLESMAGLAGGVRDALTRYTRPLTGAYYLVPATESLRRRAGGDRGFEVARRLQHDSGGTRAPVILISTHAEQDYAELIAASPAIGFLPKSVLSADAIRDLLGEPG